MRVDYRNIEQETLKNELYRKVLYSVPNRFQLVLMCLKPGEDIPVEVHSKGVQFIRVESGTGKAVVNRIVYRLKDGVTITIPPGAKHYISNTSRTKSLKLYAVYTPPEHAPNRVNKRQPKK